VLATANACMRFVRSCSLTEKEALTGLITALTDGELDPPTGCLPSGRKRSFVTSLILSTSPFIAVIEKSPPLLEHLLLTHDHRTFDIDDTLCHNVARVLTSLIESKNSATGLLGYAKANRALVAKKFFNSMDCDAMLFIYLEMIGASEDKRLEDLEAYCRDFEIMNTLLEMLATSTNNAIVKNLLEAIVTVSSCFADKTATLTQLVSKRSINAVVTSAVKAESPNGTVCRLAALTHLAILETGCVTAAVAEQLPAIRSILGHSPSSYAEARKHEIFEQPVGSIRIAVIELLVAFIDKTRDQSVEAQLPGLIEEVMVFFCEHTKNDFIGIEMVQLVRRVLASNIKPRIIDGMLSMRVLESMRCAIEQVSNIWELGHMRCIVSDLLAKKDEDAMVRTRMESYPEWDALHKLMLDMKDAKVIAIRHKRRRGEAAAGAEEQDGVALPVSPLSPLAAGALHKVMCNGQVVHEDTPRKVMYVTAAPGNGTGQRVPTPQAGTAPAASAAAEPEANLTRELF
jgi:hypothetical protein